MSHGPDPRILLVAFLLAPVVYVLVGYFAIPEVGLTPGQELPRQLAFVFLIAGSVALVLPFIFERAFGSDRRQRLRAQGKDPAVTLFIVGGAAFESITLLALLMCIFGFGRDWLIACAVFSIGMIAYWGQRCCGLVTGRGGRRD